MLRLGIEYDVLPRESEILHLQFWAAAFEQLKERQAIDFETAGKHAGCWVMPGLSENRAKSSCGRMARWSYTGKDIAYQLWKFGLLGKDFYYRPMKTYADGRELWVTTDQPTGREAQFGRRIARLQRDRFAAILSAGRGGRRAARPGLRRAGRAVDPLLLRDGGAFAALLRRTGHSALRRGSQAAVRRSVGTQGTGRQGRRPDGYADRQGAGRSSLPACRKTARLQNRAVATQIAIAALRYFLLKFTRNTVIAFDLQEALSFEGETGPYVQYAAVRARKILRKIEERGESDARFRGRTDRRSDGAAAGKSRISGRCCWRRQRPIRRWKTR